MPLVPQPYRLLRRFRTSPMWRPVLDSLHPLLSWAKYAQSGLQKCSSTQMRVEALLVVLGCDSHVFHIRLGSQGKLLRLHPAPIL